MYPDYHVHTAYSDDSDYPMEQVVLDAIEIGLAEICFTDHIDYGVKRDWDDPRGMLYREGGPGEPKQMPLANIDHPRYAVEIAMLKEKYTNRITIKMGAEFGVQQHTITQYQRLFGSYPYDFIILSVHQIGDQEFWTQDYQRRKSQEQYNFGYYEEILALIEKYQDYSVLGHLDLITRYDLAGVFPFDKLRPILTAILKNVIQEGKGIEVNTSGYRYRLQELTPSRKILELYRNLGGRILTVGSDSHKKAHLGSHIPDTMKLLKDMGFKQICTYERMEPIFHNIL